MTVPAIPFTPAQLRQAQASVDSDGYLLLLLIDVIGGNDPVRLVNDTRNWTIGGQTYIGLPLRYTPPQDVAGEAARARIEVDNVARDVLPLLEALPPNSAMECTQRFVSRDDPEIVIWEYVCGISGADADSFVLSFSLGDDAFMRTAAIRLRYDNDSAQDIFEG